MPSTVSDSCLRLNTDTTSPKLEKASFTAWSRMSSGRKIVTKIGSFPFLRRLIRFQKFRHISELPFSIQRPKQTLKGKLCTEHQSQSLPQILEYGKYPILESIFGGFFWAHYVAKQQWSLLNPGRVILLQRLVPCSSSSWALQSSGVWHKILLRSKTIFLWR